MKREILFRGKSPKGHWIYGMPSYDLKYIFNDSNYDSYDQFEIIPETVGQFTGLTDKNGVKIFEGDIIAGDGEDMPNRIVEWSNDYLGYFVGLGQDTCQDPLYDVVLPEVIGNLHDDPELI